MANVHAAGAIRGYVYHDGSRRLVVRSSPDPPTRAFFEAVAATVTVGNACTTANGSGYFVLNNVPAGRQTLEATYVGGISVSGSVTITANTTVDTPDFGDIPPCIQGYAYVDVATNRVLAITHDDTVPVGFHPASGALAGATGNVSPDLWSTVEPDGYFLVSDSSLVAGSWSVRVDLCGDMSIMTDAITVNVDHETWVPAGDYVLNDYSY